jgi:uncharacterized cupredoxin-like copper-binding protein
MLAAAAVVPSCSGGTTARPVDAQVAVTITDFKIAPAGLSAGPGDVRISVHNESPVTHEFVVVRSDLPADGLPLGSDGLSVDEEQVDVVDELGEIPTKDTAELTLDLAPGRYVFFCNLEGHYLGGMHAALEVAGA